MAAAAAAPARLPTDPPKNIGGRPRCSRTHAHDDDRARQGGCAGGRIAERAKEYDLGCVIPLCDSPNLSKYLCSSMCIGSLLASVMRSCNRRLGKTSDKKAKRVSERVHVVCYLSPFSFTSSKQKNLLSPSFLRFVTLRATSSNLQPINPHLPLGRADPVKLNISRLHLASLSVSAYLRCPLMLPSGKWRC